LRAQYEDFLSAVREGRQPLVTAGAAANALSVVEAIYRSAATGLPVPVNHLEHSSDPGAESPQTDLPPGADETLPARRFTEQ
jgi:GFO/IDH/MocA oxidoreductase family protein